MVEFGGEHHGGPDLRRIRAWKGADYDITWLQFPSRSSFSNRSRDAVVASRRSSSDQESDQSTRRPPARSASCCAQVSTFPASSGGSIRTTSMSDSSLALRTMAFIPRSQFNAVRPPTKFPAGDAEAASHEVFQSTRPAVRSWNRGPSTNRFWNFRGQRGCLPRTRLVK
jgi:hypothetical protein